MNEDILAAVHRNEAEALLWIVPFDLAFDFLGRPGRPVEGALPRRRPAAESRTATRSRRLRGAGIDGGDFGDLRALRTLPHAYRQRGARFERGMPSSFDDADVQKRLAGPVGQLDESETLFTIEPLHLGLPFRPCWHRPRRLPRRTVKGPRRRASK